MFLTKRLGIDLGTSRLRIAVPGRGGQIVIDEPTVVTLSTQENAVLAAGSDAANMVGRAPESVSVINPMREGVIDDYRIVEALLRYYMGLVVGRFNLVRPEVMIATPAGVTNVEQRAVRDAAEQAGARRPAHLIANPLAAAIGAGVPMGDARGALIGNLGAGRSEAAVLSMYGVVVWESARVGGEVVTETIADHVKRRHSLLIGEPTAEELKFAAGSAIPVEDPVRAEVRGRDQSSGMPRSVTITANELVPSVQQVLQTFVEVTRSTLERTPPELTADIIDRGMLLTGAAARLQGIDAYLAEQVGIPVTIADNAEDAVALGAAEALDNLDIVGPNLLAQESVLGAAEAR
ncbi:MAG: rod shape-determining protein [Chloroflexi bacterium]|nr:rod shape-determining protein [Chloroflexota bacterium]MYC00541.1 rod shape-determining protein [Chloroflexota bacterium]